MADVAQLNARRYARRILRIHLALLATVLAAVALAAHQIYKDAYAEVVEQAEERQRLLTVQTAHGIGNHYQSILTDMDLLRRANMDEAGSTAEPTRPSATNKAAATKPAPGRPGTAGMADSLRLMVSQDMFRGLVDRFLTSPRTAQVATGIVWRQLDGRAVMLFSCDRAALSAAGDRGATRPAAVAGTGDPRPPDDRDRQPDVDEPPGGRGGPDDEPPGGRGRRGGATRPGGPRGGGGPDEPPDPVPATRGTPPENGWGAARGGAGERATGPRLGTGGRRSADARRPAPPWEAAVTTYGSSEPGLDPATVLSQSGAWLRGLTGPAVGGFEFYPVAEGKGVRANLIGVPLEGDRVLVAVLPLRRVESDYLTPLAVEGLRPHAGQTLAGVEAGHESASLTTAWLVDQRGTIMAASRPDLVGTNVAGIADPTLNGLARRAAGGYRAATGLVDHAFGVGPATFAASTVAVEPVTARDRQWELVVTTPLDEVDGAVNALFRQALLWCLFVVCAVTAILVSTAAQMIRHRTRAERQRHDVLKSELAQARQIQLAWLPTKPPPTARVDVAAVNSPASHISGDFYNWFELPDRRLVVTVGDVTGHGMAAAFLMATTQLLVRNTMAQLADPARCLDEVNRQLCVQVFNGQFVTMLVVVLDPAGGKLHLATAGHPAPLLSGADGYAALPVEPQLVLGVDAAFAYRTETYDLPRGAAMLLYTDGVVECPDAADARFGDDRLRHAVAGQTGTAKAMLDRVVAAVNAFRGERDLDDDLTLVAVQLAVA